MKCSTKSKGKKGKKERRKEGKNMVRLSDKPTNKLMNKVRCSFT